MFAELHHKIPVIEDVLTSNVFGCYKYLPYKQGLMPFLKKVESWQGNKQEDANNEFQAHVDKADDFSIRFWPRLDDRSEPDAVIILENGKGESKAIVGIEAKHGSTMGMYGETDEEDDRSEERNQYQVALQLANFRNRNAPFLRDINDKEVPSYAIYLTHHIACPRESLREAFNCEEEDVTGNHVFWASWRMAYKAASETIDVESSGCTNMLEDLKVLLKQIGYGVFEGWLVDEMPASIANWAYPRVATSRGFSGWDMQSVSAGCRRWHYPLDEFNT